nr:PREDICTED: LOW QUALITY PROTEIN: G-protein coupled receptor 78 [Bos mutus]
MARAFSTTDSAAGGGQGGGVRSPPPGRPASTKGRGEALPAGLLAPVWAAPPLSSALVLLCAYRTKLRARAHSGVFLVSPFLGHRLPAALELPFLLLGGLRGPSPVEAGACQVVGLLDTFLAFKAALTVEALSADQGPAVGFQLRGALHPVPAAAALGFLGLLGLHATDLTRRLLPVLSLASTKVLRVVCGHFPRRDVLAAQSPYAPAAFSCKALSEEVDILHKPGGCGAAVAGSGLSPPCQTPVPLGPGCIPNGLLRRRPLCPASTHHSSLDTD